MLVVGEYDQASQSFSLDHWYLKVPFVDTYLPGPVHKVSRSSLERSDFERKDGFVPPQALGNIGPAARDAIPDLISLLDHQNSYVRIYASVALIRIQPKNQEALNSMSSLLKDQNVEVRRHTLWELKDIGKEASPAKNVSEASMSHTDEEVRKTASKILKALREP